jgi:S1-C subfamily serine protease
MTNQQDDNPLSRFSSLLSDAVAKAARPLVGVGDMTGLVVDPDEGLFITVAHRLRRRKGAPLSVALPDGATAVAEVRAVDSGLDIALLHAEGLPAEVPDWASAPPAVGSLAITVGKDDESVRATMGMVSAVKGAWRTRDGERVPHWIEVDATLPRASAGGILINAEGQAVGWNTPALTRKGAVLPPQTVLAAVERLKRGGGANGFLGIRVQLVNLDADTRGLLVSSVGRKSAAAAAGLAVGDVLLAVDAVPLDDSGALLGALRGRAGETVTVRFSRGGSVVTASVTPKPRPQRRRCG